MAKKKSRVNEAGNYTKPEMRKRLFQKIKAGSKGGDPGEWSARKAQLLALEYKKRGGGYKSLSKSRQSLKDWTRQKWRTSDGKPSKGKRRYLPDAAWNALSPAEKAATNRAKAEGNRRGKQFVKQPKKIAEKTRRYR
jgi:hypothetical protein